MSAALPFIPADSAQGRGRSGVGALPFGAQTRWMRERVEQLLTQPEQLQAA